jgi:hypothetical protein
MDCAWNLFGFVQMPSTVAGAKRTEQARPLRESMAYPQCVRQADHRKNNPRA